MKSVLSSFAIGAALLLGSTSLSLAFEEGKLLIWLGPNKGDAELRKAVEKFTADTGVAVTVEVVDPLTDKFQQAAATADGPDIVLWAHDRFGEWAASGLIKPIDPSADIKGKIIDVGWDAVTFDGKVWGYPLSVEAIGLIYNKKLVPTPPASDVPPITAAAIT